MNMLHVPGKVFRKLAPLLPPRARRPEAALGSQKPGQCKCAQAGTGLCDVPNVFCHAISSAIKSKGAEFFGTAHAAATSGSAWGWLAAYTAS